MQLGLSTYTYTWSIGVPGYPTPQCPMSTIDLLKKAKEYSVALVQLCDNIPLHTLTREELQEIRDAASAWGIQLEVGTRGVEPDHLLNYLEITKYLNATLLRVILQKNNGHITVEEAGELILEVLPAFEKEKVSIAIENHERHRVDELVSLVERVHSPYVGICMDTVNSFGALEGPKYVIESMAPYTINLHIKDFAVKRLVHMMGFQVTGTPAGSGQLDLPFLANTLRSYGKEPNAILELWTPYTDNVEDTITKEHAWADTSIKFLKEWLK